MNNLIPLLEDLDNCADFLAARGQRLVSSHAVSSVLLEPLRRYPGLHTLPHAGALSRIAVEHSPAAFSRLVAEDASVVPMVLAFTIFLEAPPGPRPPPPRSPWVCIAAYSVLTSRYFSLYLDTWEDTVGEPGIKPPGAIAEFGHGACRLASGGLGQFH